MQQFSFEGRQHGEQPQGAALAPFCPVSLPVTPLTTGYCYLGTHTRTHSEQNKQEAQSDASTFQIICKVQRFLQNGTTA